MNKKPLVIIMRGLPGCGKSYYIDTQLCNSALSSNTDLEVFSADHYFTDNNGIYRFDPKHLGAAHAACFKSYLDFLAQLDVMEVPEMLVVDNTNISAYEMAPYIQAANAYGLDHKIVTLWCNPKLAAQRNTHDVPNHTILAMYQKLLKEELPPFWKHQVTYQIGEL
jgi:predicted kinase